MARIALGITLLLLLVTSFFAFKTKSNVSDLNDKVASLQIDATNANQAKAKAEADLKSSQDELAKAKNDAQSAQSQLTSVQSNLDDATKKVTADDAQIQQLQAQIAAIPTTGTSSGPVNVITQAQVDALNAQISEDKAQIAELNQVKETLSNKEKDAESRADDLQKQVDHYKNGTLRNGLEGEVLAVNQGWNFVVLSLGDHQGAVTNAEMILTRGGTQIGKVRITSVEPSTSVADIIPGSLSRGVRVQPGDHVIFPGS